MARKPKPSGRPLSARRRSKRLPLRKRFLIVCEGEQTEPNYFRRFPTNVEVIVVGVGRDPQGVVRFAKQERQRTHLEPHDQVWVVFDKDEISDIAFNAAIQEARKAGIKVAYSNPAFELWFLLHFVYQSTALTRRDCQKRLQQYLERPYRKNDPDLYDRLLKYQEQAIQNAERLEAQYSPAIAPARRNPYTAVHHLVQSLRRAAAANG